jgi:hypothetical protein
LHNISIAPIKVEGTKKELTWWSQAKRFPIFRTGLGYNEMQKLNMDRKLYETKAGMKP